MIIKSYEINKIDLDKISLFLLYGKNEGHKNESIKILTGDKDDVLSYDEKEILEDKNSFIENTFTKSLFEPTKKIIIKRASDKVIKIVEEIKDANLDHIKIIINADNLDRKSKLRTFFEKSKKYVCIPFYPDNDQTLSKISLSFFKDKKISISPSDINIIVSKCNGDRGNLMNELNKIYYFSKNGKKVSTENILKLTNLTENHSISELVDSCLAKNKKKTISILNENNFNSEDCILITRTFLNKSKRILKLAQEYSIKKNIDTVISSAKPPIFWKDKEITKQQIFEWSPKKIKILIYKLNELELLVKKNTNNAINLITDFILLQSSIKANN